MITYTFIISCMEFHETNIDDEHHYIVAMLHYGERKHSCVQELNLSSNWFESKFCTISEWQEVTAM